MHILETSTNAMVCCIHASDKPQAGPYDSLEFSEGFPKSTCCGPRKIICFVVFMFNIMITLDQPLGFFESWVSGFRFRQFLWGKGFLCISVQLRGWDSSGSGFGSWKNNSGGSDFGSWKTWPPYPGLRSLVCFSMATIAFGVFPLFLLAVRVPLSALGKKRSRRFRFPVPVRLLGHPEEPWRLLSDPLLRKHININEFGGLSWDWMGDKILFMHFLGGHSLWGRKTHGQNPQKIPG